ncbi:MAG: DUF262 domain-containing protein [Firmicutes bacterium]|nr:DUF262 domain-containing protein [Bacillota bacterium]
MTRSSLNAGVNKLKKWWDDEAGTLRCTLPFQRHSGVWSAYTRSSLIWSLLSDSYIPPVVLLKDKAEPGKPGGEKDKKGAELYIYEILDGQQRLTNIFAFLDDEWALHSATPPVRYDGFEYDIAGKRFSELEPELQNEITQFRLIIQTLEDYTLPEAEALFYNINSGVALSAVQKAKSRMGTALITFLSKLLSGTFFTQALNITDAQAKREDDLLMLLQAVLLLDNRSGGAEYKTISAAYCESYAVTLRDSYGADKQELLGGIVGYLDEAFPARNKFLSKNNVPIILVMAQVAMENGIAAKDFNVFVNTFANSMYPSYKEASGSGNVKARSVQMRLRVMFLAFCRYFDLPAEEVRPPFAEDIPLYEGLTEEDDLLSEEDPLPKESPLPKGSVSPEAGEQEGAEGEQGGPEGREADTMQRAEGGIGDAGAETEAGQAG